MSKKKPDLLACVCVQSRSILTYCTVFKILALADEDNCTYRRLFFQHFRKNSNAKKPWIFALSEITQGHIGPKTQSWGSFYLLNSQTGQNSNLCLKKKKNMEKKLPQNSKWRKALGAKLWTTTVEKSLTCRSALHLLHRDLKITRLLNSSKKSKTFFLSRVFHACC